VGPTLPARVLVGLVGRLRGHPDLRSPVTRKRVSSRNTGFESLLRTPGQTGAAPWRPLEAWVRPKGHLLPFCSHTTPNHPELRDTKQKDERGRNCSSFQWFLARSTGCRHGLKTTHNPKVAGSNPAPATKRNQGLRRDSPEPLMLSFNEHSTSRSAPLQAPPPHPPHPQSARP